ncbi:uridine-cytidine kinase-like 1 [Argonauta hians]
MEEDHAYDTLSSGSERDSMEDSEMTDPDSNSPDFTQSPPTKLPKSPVRTLSKRVRSVSTSSCNDRVVQTATRTLYTAGRPPWYNCHGELKEAFVIGLCGGSSCGKTTVANKIIEALKVPWVSVLSMDSFYKALNEEESALAAKNEYNFDHPDAFDLDLLYQTLKRLKKGKNVEVPVYDFTTHSRKNVTTTLYGANVVVFEGIMAFVNKKIRDLCDMKIFVDTDSDECLARRLRRDIAERGRDMHGILKLYNKFVKPSFDYYIAPTMSYADIIVPHGGQNNVAINLIVLHVHNELQKHGFKLRSKLATSAMAGQPMPSNLHVLEMTPQVQGLHTFIRNCYTPRSEFIFYSKRLLRMLFELALSMLPFKNVTVETAENILYEGKTLDTKKICGVSILRAGETMESALGEVCKDVVIGKILIQTNFDTGEPELHYLRLPRNIRDCHVMLMDATVATGAAAMMAIRVLLDHDVPEENITLLSLLMALSGVHSIAYAFPKVKIVTTAVDKEVNEKFHILPGLGNFGDRYFGTNSSAMVSA